MIFMDKKNLRLKVRKIRENLSIEDKKRMSKIIINNFLKLEELKKSKIIMSYMDMKNEVETRELNEKLKNLGKTILLPSIEDGMIKVYKDDGHYKISKLGVSEPYANEYNGKIDLILVPGIVFNSKGDRIGFGKGYYDKFLSKNIYKNTVKVSMIYDFQLIEDFSGEEFDEKIDILIKESNILKIPNIEK